MECGPVKESRSISWSPLPVGVFKLNFDEASRGNPGRVGIGEVLSSFKGKVILMLSKNVVVYDSSVAKMLAKLEGLKLFSRSYVGDLITESDLSNAIIWLSNQKKVSMEITIPFK